MTAPDPFGQIEMDVVLVRETGPAICVRAREGGPDTWLPKQLIFMGPEREDGTMTIRLTRALKAAVRL